MGTCLLRVLGHLGTSYVNKQTPQSYSIYSQLCPMEIPKHLKNSYMKHLFILPPFMSFLVRFFVHALLFKTFVLFLII